MLKIKEIREVKNLTQDQVVALSGIKKRSYVDYESGKSDIPFTKLQKIARALHVSISQITGEEELPKMVVKKNFETRDHNASFGKPRNVFSLRSDKNIQNQDIPLYNIEATAGLVELFQNHQDTTPIDTLHIPNLPKCDGAVFVTGDSMYPLLKSGDIVAYKQIEDLRNDIFFGEMYLVSVDVAQEEFISVKYVQRSEKGDDYIKLVSQNAHHQPKDVHLSKVRALALVKASVRINSMS
ncbi:XRE family transcriptional regulator [uncultured Psychroserpens sp.]|uniref:XRE family transcriptional regulator n=1 Tax=uncultured Psychroserpens sp. TaxID=255436 RepID=UPI0026285AF7|nr:XRE family transcriptional regulator [uncultured Psychroserpens sp.]